MYDVTLRTYILTTGKHRFFRLFDLVTLPVRLDVDHHQLVQSVCIGFLGIQWRQANMSADRNSTEDGF